MFLRISKKRLCDSNYTFQKRNKRTQSEMETQLRARNKRN